MPRSLAQHKCTAEVHTRYHTVQEFNKGVYDYIIASDESTGRAEQDSDDEPENDDSAAAEEEEEDCTFDHTLLRTAKLTCPTSHGLSTRA